MWWRCIFGLTYILFFAILGQFTVPGGWLGPSSANAQGMAYGSGPSLSDCLGGNTYVEYNHFYPGQVQPTFQLAEPIKASWIRIALNWQEYVATSDKNQYFATVQSYVGTLPPNAKLIICATTGLDGADNNLQGEIGQTVYQWPTTPAETSSYISFIQGLYAMYPNAYISVGFEPNLQENNNTSPSPLTNASVQSYANLIIAVSNAVRINGFTGHLLNGGINTFQYSQPPQNDNAACCLIKKSYYGGVVASLRNHTLRSPFLTISGTQPA